MTTLHLPSDQALALAKATLHDRIVGALFGSALGDAIGLYTEFLSQDVSMQAYPGRRFKLSPAAEATPFRRDRHRGKHQPGEWTDDTDHALLIILGFLHKDGKEFDPNELASRLSIWAQMGLRALDTLPLGLGKTVGAIVRTKTYLDDPEGGAMAYWVKTGYDAAPNGSLMRTHPLGLMCLSKTLHETFQIGADYSVITHVDPRCILSCSIGTALVRGLLRGEINNEDQLHEILRQGQLWYCNVYRVRQEADPTRKNEPPPDLAEFNRHAWAKGLGDLKLDEPGKIGYVYKTFGSGMFLLRQAMREFAAFDHVLSKQMSIFEPSITDLVLRGGDADTNACFAGALLGAYIGYKALPPSWRDGLKHGEFLMNKATALSKVLGVIDGAYSGAEDRDTFPDGGRGFLTSDQMDEKVMLLQARMVKDEQEWNAKETNKKKKNSWFSRR